MAINPDRFKREPITTHIQPMRDHEVLYGVIGWNFNSDVDKAGMPLIRRVLELYREEKINAAELFLAVGQQQLITACFGTLATDAYFNLEDRVIHTTAPGYGPYAEGKLALTREAAVRYKEEGTPYIFVTGELNASDVPLMKAAKGVVLIDDELDIDRHSLNIVDCPSYCVLSKKFASFPEEGALVSMHPTESILCVGSMEIVNGGDPDAPEFAELIRIARESGLDKTLPFAIGAIVNNNAEAVNAIKHGATHIGPVRGEYFLSGEGRKALIQALTAKQPEDAAQAEATLEEDMTTEYVELLKHAKETGVSVEIRLLDAPLHKLCGTSEYDTESIHRQFPALKTRDIIELSGMKGVRLGLKKPSIYQAQLKAILRAAHEVADVSLQVTIPFLCKSEDIKDLQNKLLGPLGLRYDQKEPFGFKAMIETPASAIGAEFIKPMIDEATIGMGDLESTVFVKRPGVYDQHVDMSNGFLHPVMEKTLQMAMQPYATPEISMVWHTAVNGMVFQNLSKYPLQTLVVTPREVLNTTVEGIHSYVSNHKNKIEEQSMQL